MFASRRTAARQIRAGSARLRGRPDPWEGDHSPRHNRSLRAVVAVPPADGRDLVPILPQGFAGLALAAGEAIGDAAGDAPAFLSVGGFFSRLASFFSTLLAIIV